MKILGFTIQRAKEKRSDDGSSIMNPGKALKEVLGIGGSGGNASLNSAQKISAFFHGIRIKSQDVSSLPLGFYKKVDGDTIPLDNEVARTFKYEPDPIARVSRYKFFESTVKSMELRGNSYAIIHPLARRIEFVPTSYVTTHQDKTTLEMFYSIFNRRGSLSNGWFTSNEILHFKGYGDNPYLGESIIKHGAKSLGIGTSQQDLQSKFYQNGSLIRDYFSTPNSLSDTAYERLKADLEGKKGVENSSTTRLLEEDLKYYVVSMKAEDVGLIQGAQLTVVDIARWVNVPPDKLFDLTKVSYASMEQSSANYALQTISPICISIEHELNIKLLKYREGEFCRFNLEALIRADAIAKAESTSKLVNAGIFERNEARGLYDRNNIDGASELFFPQNAIPQSKVDAYFDAKIEQMKKGMMPLNNKGNE